MDQKNDTPIISGAEPQFYKCIKQLHLEKDLESFLKENQQVNPEDIVIVEELFDCITQWRIRKK